MKKFEKTNRKNVYVKYYKKEVTEKKSTKIIVTAQLFDNAQNRLDGCSASHTQQTYESYEDARIAARINAEKKFDKIFNIATMIGADGESNQYFTDRWMEIRESDRADLAPASKDGSKERTIKYFENNVLKLLDAYGPNISPDQCREISEELYSKMLLNKKYKYCFVTLENTSTIQKFISVAKDFFVKDKNVKAVLGGFPKKSHIDMLMDSIQTKILEEDRIRTLLEVALSREADLCKFVSEFFRDKIKADGVLIEKMRKLKSEENRTIAEKKIIFLLREFSGNEAQSKVQTNIHIQDANEILRNLNIKNDKVMPVVTLPKFVVTTPPQIETCKELPWVVRVRFSAVSMYIADKCAWAVGGIVMMTSAPRVSEVLAIQFGDILDYGDWGMCVINYTADGEIRKEDGKNIYFHRAIFFPKFAMDAIHKRKQHLLCQGYSEAKIAKAYIVNRDNDLFVPEKPHRFSEKIKKLLKFAGCNDDYWDSVRYAMIMQPDYDYFRRPELFEIAYGLRRDGTTLMCNIAKMDTYKIDAIQGHRLPNYVENWHDKITRQKEWKIIIDEMERIVYDPDHSNHPMFKPRNIMELKEESQSIGKKIISYQSVSVNSDQPVHAVIVVKSVGNSDIYFNAPKECEFNYWINSIANTVGPSQRLGRMHTKEEYDSVKVKAIEDYLREWGE